MPARYSWTLADRTPSWSCAACDRSWTTALKRLDSTIIAGYGQRPERQPRVHGEHREQRAGEREGGGGEAHRAEADEGLDGGDVARGARHQVARRVGGVEARREREEARVEVVAQVVLDPLATADDREPRAETRHAVGEREDDDESHVLCERGARRVVLEGVDRPLERPGDRERGKRREAKAGDARGVADPIARDVSPDRARGRRQARLPAA